jgi:hypothetical protein
VSNQATTLSTAATTTTAIVSMTNMRVREVWRTGGVVYEVPGTA